MEIGISTPQLIDIGLNVAGFLSAGALLVLIRSMFSKRRGKIVPAIGQSPIPIEADTNKPANRPEIDKNSTVEFINLKGLDWNPRHDTVSSRAAKKTDPPNRRKIINLAKTMLSNARRVRTKSQPETDRRPVAGIAELIRNGAGR